MVNKSELLCVVDEYDVPAEPKPRHETHAKGLWHRTAHVWIVNDKKQLLCQKRSALKDQFPELWEPFVGGHIAPGDDYFTGAVKEVREETGIPIERSDLNFLKVYKDGETREFRGVFYLKWNGSLDELTSEAEEVDDVRWIDISSLKKHLLAPVSPTWCRAGYEKEMLKILIQG